MITLNLTRNGYSEADMMKPLQMKCGIEYEYMLIDTEGEQTGRLRNFTNLDFQSIADLLEEKPGKLDKTWPRQITPSFHHGRPACADFFLLRRTISHHTAPIV